jgi:hypothetical protein
MRDWCRFGRDLEWVEDSAAIGRCVGDRHLSEPRARQGAVYPCPPQQPTEHDRVLAKHPGQRACVPPSQVEHTLNTGVNEPGIAVEVG